MYVLLYRVSNKEVLGLLNTYIGLFPPSCPLPKKKTVAVFIKVIPSISDTLYLVMCAHVCVGGGLEMGAKKFVLSCILLFDVMHGYTLGMS